MYQVQLSTQRNLNFKPIFILFSLQLRIGIKTATIPNRLKRQLADEGFILYWDTHSQFAESNLSFPRCSLPEMFIEIPNFFLKNVEKTNKSLSTM